MQKIHVCITVLCCFFLVSILSGCGGGGGGSSTPATTTTQTTDVSGTWRGTLTSSTVTTSVINLEITLMQSGSSVAGTMACYANTVYCTIPTAKVTGTVTGSTLVLQLLFPDGDTCTTSGTVSSNTISGQYDSCKDSSSSGPFTLTKASAASSLSNIAGTWKAGDNSSVTLTQSGASLSGSYACTISTCLHSSGTVTGTVSGNTFTLQLLFSDLHSMGFFNVTISGNNITGFASTDEPTIGKDASPFTLTNTLTKQLTIIYQVSLYIDEVNTFPLPENNAANLADFETNYMAQAIKVDTFIPQPPYADVYDTYTVFKARLTNPPAWSDVIYVQVDAKYYTLYLIQ